MSQSKGYLLIDHRASPGLPEDLALRLGLDPKQVAGGRLYEADTLTCVHCKTVVVKNLFRERERASCSKCSFRYICDFCAAAMRQPDYDHVPFEKLVDKVLDADAKGQPLGSPAALLGRK
jgi:hypothetical protein